MLLIFLVIISIIFIYRYRGNLQEISKNKKLDNQIYKIFLLLFYLLISESAFASESSTTNISYFKNNSEDVNLCISEWENNTLPAIDELKKEILCKRDKSTEICKFLIFPENYGDQFSYEANNTGNDSKSSSKSSPNILKSSQANAIRAMRHVVRRIEGNLKFSPLRTIEDFVQHTRLHKERLVKLIEAAFVANPEEFHGLTKEQVLRAAHIHDDEKLYSFSNRAGGRPYYQDLHENLGQKITDRNMINTMNKVGDDNLEKLFNEIGLEIKDEMSEKQIQLIRLQQETLLDQLKMADEGDRMWDPMTRKVEYRFRNGQRPRDVKFLTKYPKTVALYDGSPTNPAAQKYFEIVRGSEYKALSDSKRYQLIKEIRMGEINAYRAGKLEAKYGTQAALDLGGRGSFYRITSLLKNSLLADALLGFDLMIYSPELGCADGESSLQSYILNSKGECVREKGLTHKIEEFLFMPMETQMKDEEGNYISKKMKILSELQSCNVFSEIKSIQDNSIQDITCNKNSVRFFSQETNDIIDIELKHNDISKIVINPSEELNSKQITFNYLQRSNSKNCINIPTKFEPCITTNENLTSTGIKFKKRFVEIALIRRQQLSYQIFKAIKSCSPSK